MTTGLRLRNVQVDAPPGREAEVVAFWAGALGATTRPGTGPYTHLVDAASPIGVHVQRLEGGEARYHLDLEAHDPDAEVARLLSLGATRVGTGDDGEVLADPAGLLLCVCPWGQVEERLRPGTPDRVALRLVVVDVPTRHVEATVGFWAGALGATVVPADASSPYTELRGMDGPAGRFGVLVQDLGTASPARFHLDLHVDDATTRDEEVTRLEALGATPAGAWSHWQVLADPAGNLLCIVPDRHDHEATT